jgi:class 3 adenylate cyclase
MQQVADWLEKLGLGQYAQRFAENDISFSILPDLTDQDLKELGVASLGHRRQLLRETASLSKTVDADQSAPPPIATPTVTPPAEATGERRHVTVMFCDLVDSTSISAKLDAEEWRDLVGAYLDAASASVTEMGGKVAKKLGDGLMALFGYPIAQENDAERAVRAALSIQRALGELNRKNEVAGKPALAARIAIDSALPGATATAARPNDPEQRHVLAHALEFMAAALLDDEQPGDLPLYPRRHHHSTRIGQRLCPCRDVRHIAENLAARIEHRRATPGSPTISTSWPLPCRARSQRRISMPISSSRPTRGVRWRLCSSWRLRGQSSGHLGACTRITAPSRSRRSTAPRYAIWWRCFPPAMRCRAM